MSFANTKRHTLKNGDSQEMDKRETTPDGGPEITNEYFSKAYQKGFQRTVRFLLSRGASQEAARDAAQDAWVKGWEMRKQLRQPSLVLTWTSTIALNMYRTMLRRERQTEPLDEVKASVHLNVAAIDVQRLLEECNPNDRIVLEEQYLDGYKTTEIARLQNCSPTAVRIRLFRARRKLQSYLMSVKPSGRPGLASSFESD